jgi:hypothetical protein
VCLPHCVCLSLRRTWRPSSILKSHVYTPVLRNMGRLHSTVQRRVKVTACADMVQPSPQRSNTGSAHTVESLLLRLRSTCVGRGGSVSHSRGQLRD